MTNKSTLALYVAVRYFAHWSFTDDTERNARRRNNEGDVCMGRLNPDAESCQNCNYQGEPSKKRKCPNCGAPFQWLWIERRFGGNNDEN